MTPGMHIGSLDHAIDSVGPVVVAVWNGTVCPRGLATLGGTLRRVRQRYPDGIGLMVVWQPPTVVPAAPVRAHLAATFTDVGPALRGVAHVVAGTGFWASAARSCVADIARLDCVPHRNVVLPDTEAAAAWTRERVGVTAGAGRVVMCAEQRARALSWARAA